MSNSKTYEAHKSSIGNMDANVMALITYIAAIVMSLIPYLNYFAWAVPLVFFIIEKKSGLVKFHAMQALVLEVVFAVIAIILAIISGIVVAAAYAGAVTSLEGALNYAAGSLGAVVIFSVITWIVCIVFTVFQIIAMINAYKYKEYKIPVIGGLAEKFSAKFSENQKNGDMNTQA